MRLLPLLMLTLLLIGFAARPTVAAAWTSGQVILHPFETISVVTDTVVDAAQGQDDQASFIHCVSLGILPTGWLVMPRAAEMVTTRRTSITAPASRAYGLLRPPQA